MSGNSAKRSRTTSGVERRAVYNWEVEEAGELVELGSGDMVELSNSWLPCRSTIRPLAQRKLAPRIGRSTFAKRKDQSKRWAPNFRGKRRAPHEGIWLLSAAVKRWEEGEIVELNGKTERAVWHFFLLETNAENFLSSFPE